MPSAVMMPSVRVWERFLATSAATRTLPLLRIGKPAIAHLIAAT